MMIQPNKTPITATIINPKNEAGNFDIVILSIPGQIVLPAFLWTGKIIEIEGKNLSPEVSLEKGKIISADIEVLGDPRTQKFLLHSIVPLEYG